MIQNFTDLIVWQKGHKLALLIYKLTDKFPSKETFSLTDQMRRCSISITSNIAEGFSRQGKKEKLQFYFMSKGSLTELHSQLFLARDVKYASPEEFLLIESQLAIVGKLLSGLIKSLKTNS